VKALSLTQPWGWLLVQGYKTVENRIWHLPPKMRGQRVLIHAAKAMPAGAYARAGELAFAIGGVSVPPPAELERGGIIGSVTFVDCFCPGALVGTYDHPADVDLRWWFREQHGFIAKEPEVLPFRPLRGMLGFFEVPEER
jgi:hypothetical protein